MISQLKKMLGNRHIEYINILISKKYFYLNLNPIEIACLVLITFTTNAIATPISISQSPPGSGGREPAPNIIISVDDSGSMGWDVNGCYTIDWNIAVYKSNFNQTGATGCVAGVASLNPSRIASLKTALLTQFGDASTTPPTKGKIEDGRIRLAWQAMHNNGNSPGADTLTLGGTNTMKSFTGTHRVNFTNFVNSLSAANGTPSHQMMSNVYDYMRSPAGQYSPWADSPGTSQSTSYLACRRTYHVFMTDGAWNQQGSLSAGNADGTNQTLGDGATSYNITSDQVRVYKDIYGGTANSASTLSDFAFRNWAKDLQDGTAGTQNMANSVSPLIKFKGTETIGNTTLQEFWNPKNDPATWQHIVQHTIGFGNTASIWTGVPLWDSVTKDTYGGDYSKLVNGTVTWQTPYPDDSNAHDDVRSFELWHSALNGRGKFYSAQTPTALTAAFDDILSNVISDTSKPLVSISANSSTLKSGLYAYIAGYNGADWSGKLVSRAIDSTTAAISATDTWNAATLLDDTNYSISNRFILSYGTPVAAIADTGFAWTTWSTLPIAQQTPLSTNSSGTIDTKGQNRLDYLRGDRTKEASVTNGVFRNRGSRLGDIVNSNVWYTGKPASGYSLPGYAVFRSTNTTATPPGKGGRIPMVYVGGNDGMLHGFSAGNWPSNTSVTTAGGKELLAYIPQGIAQGDLRKLTDTTYSHEYFVDGSPFTGDAYIDTTSTTSTTPTWKTVLLGTLGAGGKGYFVLDVTDPANFTTANAGSLVIKDTTAVDSWTTPDKDIGYITALPVVDDAIAGKSRQIVRMNDNRWAVVMGNGYNSTNEAPVLLIQYLDGTKDIVKVSPCTAPIATTACSFKGSNGLSSPQLIDLNGDGKVDIAYAGDLKGNLWKFDLSSTTASNWKMGVKDGSNNSQPLFVAKPSASVFQPITAAPFWMQHPNGGIMLVVGTGQNLTTADQTSTDRGSVYGIWDNSAFTSSTNSVTLTNATAVNDTTSTSLPSTLVQQTISTTTVVDSGITYYTSSSNPVVYTGANPKRGWYMNYTNDGQRVLQNPRAFSGQKVLIQSTIPRSGGVSSGETCTPTATPERSFFTILNSFTGNPSVLPVFSLNSTTTSNLNITGMENSPGGDNWFIRNGDNILVANPNSSAAAKKINPDKYIGIRANWREIQ